MVFTQVFTFWGIYLFTNRVITHYGSNFLKISWNLADLREGERKNLQVNTLRVNTWVFTWVNTKVNTELGGKTGKYPGKNPGKYLVNTR